MLTFQLESWSQYFADCQALWLEHYEEIAVDKARMPMHPDIDAFWTLDRQGQLSIVTVREAGVLVGYMLLVVKPHPHYADILCAFEDSYFMTSRLRKGLAGVKLFSEAEHFMRQRGVKKLFFMTKNFKNLGSIFIRLGFTLSDTCYAKWIGD